MPDIPRDSLPDGTLALFRDPYLYISKRCRRFGTELFRTRILLQDTICMTGPAAAEVFYDPARFIRHGAAPMRVQKTLFGRGGVQSLDGEAHRHRKQMFMSLMTPERIAALGELTDDAWRSAARRWATSGQQLVLYDEAREVLCRAVCAWAGVPLPEGEVEQRTREISALFGQAGKVGPRHWMARLARRRTNRWAGRIIEQIRSGTLAAPPETAAHVIASHRDLDGRPLDTHSAAVELLNVLRPTVAIAVFIAFIARTLHERPECSAQLREDDPLYTEYFVQEVRRFYPFFPSVIALVREDFEWNGYRFPQGTRVVLDLYGTNHDPRAWDAPDQFRPERFAHWNGSPFNFIPQGGGEHHENHRCPGEWITIELMKRAALFLAGGVAYDVPPQDLDVKLNTLPALPASKFVISNVRMLNP